MKKESRFSYIRPVDGVTRLKFCNCSKITILEQTVHRKSQVIVEISNSCMIVFIGDTYHAGVSSIERSNGSYPSFLRIFSYIVEDDYITDDENISILNKVNYVKIIVKFLRILTWRSFITQIKLSNMI